MTPVLAQGDAEGGVGSPLLNIGIFLAFLTLSYVAPEIAARLR